MKPVTCWGCEKIILDCEQYLFAWCDGNSSHVCSNCLSSWYWQIRHSIYKEAQVFKAIHPEELEQLIQHQNAMKPNPDIDLINNLRLRPGDSIYLLHGGPHRWIKFKRTLLWHGEQLAVWSATSESSHYNPGVWTEPIETAEPCGMGDWRRVVPNA